ncbi:MAG: Cell division and transport-associated protein TolA [Candidatus Kentron sp. G]|nr:MAG: Cell division and transport-associated protein TolA [Candidatus Kentron sp. G]VFN01019.1 MAG: Cell division and transport-associated protein TolA [Candidatus Kentron sp. G]VFN02347.1 MAG: Cell division and transport-associated protein TolA [Candidatus Kentron sp. G]
MKFRSFTGKAKALFFAIAVHAAFIVVLLLNFDWSPEVMPPRSVPKQQKIEPIQAKVVDEAKVQAELAEIEKRKQMEREAEKARMQKLERQARAARERREKEERKLADIERKLKEKQEQKRKEEAKREAERQRKEKAEKERRRKAEEKAAKEKAARKKAAAARKKKEQERKRQEAEKALQEKLAAEQAERDRQRQRLLDQYRLEYITDIKFAVERNWIRPPGAAKGLKCKLKVTQTQDGRVLDVSITVSSGNPGFDRSAVAAVFKASPLPKPRDSSVFDRNIVFTLLNPEN